MKQISIVHSYKAPAIGKWSVFIQTIRAIAERLMHNLKKEMQIKNWNGSFCRKPFANRVS
jgi:hypothetical protein